MTQPAALSELSVTEFVTLARLGFFPRGLVIGSCMFSAGSQYDWIVRTGEIERLSRAMHSARELAVARMRAQAVELGAEGIVDVRLEVEHHLWRGARQVAKCIAIGTAVTFEAARAPAALRHAPSLRLADGSPFDSDLSTADFVTLLEAGYRPITVAMGNCVYGLDPRELRDYRGSDSEITSYTQAFFDARESAMQRLQDELYAKWQLAGPRGPAGIVGMTVTEATYGGGGAASGPPIVEFTAIGTAVALMDGDDPRRAAELPKPRVVVPLDR
ncbi:MAG TPA: heavy metal-binding domain-containing protein [Kofleriaceae bacterium]|nr:heavy metal-binding domain-containing protein [Kofleriaceae bacterium]